MSSFALTPSWVYSVPTSLRSLRSPVRRRQRRGTGESRRRREQEKELVEKVPEGKGEGAIVGHLSDSCSSTTASSAGLSGGEGVRE